MGRRALWAQPTGSQRVGHDWATNTYTLLSRAMLYHRLTLPFKEFFSLNSSHLSWKLMQNKTSACPELLYLSDHPSFWYPVIPSASLMTLGMFRTHSASPRWRSWETTSKGAFQHPLMPLSKTDSSLTDHPSPLLWRFFVPNSTLVYFKS